MFVKASDTALISSSKKYRTIIWRKVFSSIGRRDGGSLPLGGDPSQIRCGHSHIAQGHERKYIAEYRTRGPSILRRSGVPVSLRNDFKTRIYVVVSAIDGAGVICPVKPRPIPPEFFPPFPAALTVVKCTGVVAIWRKNQETFPPILGGITIPPRPLLRSSAIRLGDMSC